MEKDIKLDENYRVVETQKTVVRDWKKKNAYIKSNLNDVKQIIYYPESLPIINNMLNGKFFDIFPVDNKVETKLIPLLEKIFKDESDVYLCYSGSHETGPTESLYPIFILNKEKIKDWLPLILFAGGSSLQVCSKDLKHVIDISDLDVSDLIDGDARTILIKSPYMDTGNSYENL